METKLKHSQAMKSNCHSLAHSVMFASPVPLATIHKWPKSMCATGNAWSGLEELQGTVRHPWGDQVLGSDGEPP